MFHGNILGTEYKVPFMHDTWDIRIIPIEFGNNCHGMNALKLWRKLPDPVMGGYYKLPSDFTWEQLVGVDRT